jgi:ankyrin repeat protein
MPGRMEYSGDAAFPRSYHCPFVGTSDDINALHTNGMSRLSVAARGGDPQKVYDLLQAGAVVQPMAEPQYGFQVPLFEATASGEIQNVQMLLDAGADPNFAAAEFIPASVWQTRYAKRTQVGVRSGGIRSSGRRRRRVR